MHYSRIGRISLCFILIFLPIVALCQELGLIPSKYYSPKEYGAGTQNWCAVQDRRGVMYFGNAYGVLEFDGAGWRLYEVSNQTAVRSIAIGSNGVVYVGAFGEMGYMQPDALGQMRYTSLMPKVDSCYRNFKEVWGVHCLGDTVFFLSDNYVFRYADGTLKCWPSGLQGFYLGFVANGKYIVQEKGRGLLTYRNDSLVLIPQSDFFANTKVHGVFSSRDGYLVGTRHNGFFLFDTSGVAPSIRSVSDAMPDARKINSYFLRNGYYHGVSLSDSLYAFSSIQGDILVVNSQWELQDVIDSETKGAISPNYSLYFQDNHNLWITLDRGICRVELRSPFRFWPEQMGITGVISDVARVGNYFYASTTAGLFYANTSERELGLSKFRKVDGNFEQAWQFLYFYLPSRSSSFYAKNPARMRSYVASDSTILLAATLSGVYQLQGSKAWPISDYNQVSCLHQSYSNPTKLLLGQLNGVAQLTYQNGLWSDDGSRYGIDANIIDIGEDSARNIWISTRFQDIYRVRNAFDSAPIVEKFDSSMGISNRRIVTFYDNHSPFLFFTSGHFYSYNDSAKQFGVYRFYKSQKAIDRQKEVSDSLSWLGVQPYINTSYYVADAFDKCVWFGTTNGLCRCIPDSSRNFNFVPSALIRKVVCADSVLFWGNNITALGVPGDGVVFNPAALVNLNNRIEFRHNSLVFHYAWPFFEGSKPNEYSYKLEGYGDAWSRWTTETKKEYTNLHEGKYTFCVKGRNIYGIESEPAKFCFEVLPPWYRTYWAYGIYAVMGLLFVALAVKLYTYKLILERDNLEQLVKERTQEILIQNEEILVQAEHLKEANDWVNAKNVELEAQKYEIERKRNELEISNATKNKFFRIIAHDLRNPISTLVNTTGFILSEYDEFDRAKTRRIIEDLNRLSLTTYGLLENLLDWSSNQMGDIPFNPKPLHLKSMVADCVELIKTKIDSKCISLDVDIAETIVVIADENMLRAVIRNILTNATKFTHEKGAVRIYTRMDTDFCHLSIADNGVGIKPDMLSKLFHIDKDVISVGTRNEKGSGLGLILCKEFMERNGGAIHVQSEWGRGSVFTVSIRLR